MLHDPMGFSRSLEIDAFQIALRKIICLLLLYLGKHQYLLGDRKSQASFMMGSSKNAAMSFALHKFAALPWMFYDIWCVANFEVSTHYWKVTIFQLFVTVQLHLIYCLFSLLRKHEEHFLGLCFSVVSLTVYQQDCAKKTGVIGNGNIVNGP